MNTNDINILLQLGDAFSPVKYPIGIDGGNAFEPA